MVKEKRILSYFIGWLILGYIICFIGINNVFALETNFENLSVQGYNNNGTSLTNPSVFNCSAGSCGMEITTNVNSYGGAWAIQSPIPLLKNHTYTLSLRIRNTAGVGITLSSKNRIAIGNSIDSVKYNYEIADYWNTLKSSVASGNYTLQFVFTPTGQASYLLVPFTTNRTITTSFMIDNIIIEDLGSEGVSQEEINNSLNNQTNTLNNSIQNSTDTITGEIDDMEQNIIDSNKETQEVIKDQFNTCRDSYNLLDISKFNSSRNGILLNNLISGKTYTFKSNKEFSWLKISDFSYGTNFVQYEGTNIYSYTFIAPENVNNLYLFLGDSTNWQINTSWFISNAQLMLNEGSSGKKYEPYGEEICSNKIDETNDKLDNLQDAITDSSSPNTGALENSAGWLPAGPLDSILNLPLTMLNSLTNSLGKTCSPLNLTLPYVNKNIQIPCLSAIFAKITGVNGLWSWVGTIASVLILYNYLLNLYAWVDRVLTLRAEFDEAMGADLANWGRL